MRCSQAGARLAVCTNKFEALSKALLRELGLDASLRRHRRARYLRRVQAGAGPSDAARSRWPAGGADRAVMVGDSEVDIATAAAAGVPSIARHLRLYAAPGARARSRRRHRPLPRVHAGAGADAATDASSRTGNGWTRLRPSPSTSLAIKMIRFPCAPQDWLLLVLSVRPLGRDVFLHCGCGPEVPPFTLVLARVGIAALAAGAARLPGGLSAPGRRLRPGCRSWCRRIINNVIPFTLMVYGQQRIASGLAAVLNATTPLFTLIVARVLAGERADRQQGAGVLLGSAAWRC